MKNVSNNNNYYYYKRKPQSAKGKPGKMQNNQKSNRKFCNMHSFIELYITDTHILKGNLAYYIRNSQLVIPNLALQFSVNNIGWTVKVKHRPYLLVQQWINHPPILLN